MNRWHLSNSIAINYSKGRLHCICNGLVQAIGHAIRLADAAFRKRKKLSPRHHNDFRNANDPLSATSSTFKGDIVCKKNSILRLLKSHRNLPGCFGVSVGGLCSLLIVNGRVTLDIAWIP